MRNKTKKTKAEWGGVGIFIIMWPPGHWHIQPPSLGLGLPFLGDGQCLAQRQGLTHRRNVTQLVLGLLRVEQVRLAFLQGSSPQSSNKGNMAREDGITLSCQGDSRHSMPTASTCKLPLGTAGSPDRSLVLFSYSPKSRLRNTVFNLASFYYLF